MQLSSATCCEMHEPTSHALTQSKSPQHKHLGICKLALTFCDGRHRVSKEKSSDIGQWCVESCTVVQSVFRLNDWHSKRYGGWKTIGVEWVVAGQGGGAQDRDLSPSTPCLNSKFPLLASRPQSVSFIQYSSLQAQSACKPQ